MVLDLYFAIGILQSGEHQRMLKIKHYSQKVDVLFHLKLMTISCYLPNSASTGTLALWIASSPIQTCVGEGPGNCNCGNRQLAAFMQWA